MRVAYTCKRGYLMRYTVQDVWETDDDWLVRVEGQWDRPKPPSLNQQAQTVLARARVLAREKWGKEITLKRLAATGNSNRWKVTYSVTYAVVLK